MKTVFSLRRTLSTTYSKTKPASISVIIIAIIITVLLGADTALSKQNENLLGHTQQLLFPRQQTSPQVFCDGDGRSGKRVQVIYAYAPNQGDYNARLPEIRQMLNDINAIFNESAIEADPNSSRRVRFVHDENCYASVFNVELNEEGDDNYENTVSQLRALGPEYNRSDRLYLVLVEASGWSTATCGQAEWGIDGQPSSDNANNIGNRYVRSDLNHGSFGRCSYDAVVYAAHEIMHALGAVLPNARHYTSSGGGHVTDGYDFLQVEFNFEVECPNYPRLDCNHDDYFHPNPPEQIEVSPGVWEDHDLANYAHPREVYLNSGKHWNTANSEFLIGAPSECITYSASGVVLFKSHCGEILLPYNTPSGLVNLLSVPDPTYDTNITADNISSIYVASGWSIRVYQDANRGGATRCVTNSLWDLSRDFYNNSALPMDDNISSFEVFNNSTCSEPTTPPSNCLSYLYDGVVLFDDNNCNGVSLQFSNATPLINLSTQSWDNRASSVHVASGWSVKAYQDANGAGASRCLTSSMWDLTVDYFDNSDINMNNAVSSVQIFGNGSCSATAPTPVPDQVKLFELANYGGGVVFSGGTGFSNDPNANSFSLQIPSGWSVKTWREDNRGGTERCWSSSVHNLQDHDWHLAIRSIEIFDSNVCPPPITPAAGQVKLFELANYGGGVVFSGGTGFSNDPNANSFSLEIPSGWSVKTWREDNRGGAERCWPTSVHNLQDHDWHLAVRSIEAFNTNVCPPPPPTAPILQSPSDGITFNDGDPINLVWSATGTEHYAEYWGGPAGTISSGWQSGTNWSIGAQLPGRTYFWRVKARNSNGESGWSATQSFFVHSDSTIPPHPVQLYLHANYQGDTSCYRDTEGPYNSLNRCGVNDQISSMILASGWSVRVFKDMNLTGVSRCFTSSDTDFGNDTFEDGSSLNDQTSSFALYHNPSCSAPSSYPVQFYIHDFYGGGGYCPAADEGNYNNLDDCPGYNDQISSITLLSGWSVRIFADLSQTGSNKCITASDINLGDDFFEDGSGANDRISSFRLYHNTSCSDTPTAPTGLVRTGATPDSITLAWQDNSTNEEGFKIYRIADTPNAPWTHIGTVGSNVTGYTNSNLSCNTAYGYKVTAYQGAGESSDTFTAAGTEQCPTVIALDAWTGDGSWNRKATFNPGDPIQWIIGIKNTTGSDAQVELTYDVSGPSGEQVARWQGYVTTGNSVWAWQLPGTVPSRLGGTHTLRGRVVYQGTSSEVITTYIVTGPTAPCPDFANPAGIGIEDIQTIANHWNLTIAAPTWNATFDLDNSYKIDIRDIMTTIGRWGNTCDGTIPPVDSIAFISDRDGDYEIYTMNIDGSGMMKLTDNSVIDVSPSWSPDGNRLVFHSTRDGYAQLYTMDAGGGNQTRLLTSSVADAWPFWSPSGYKIAFAREANHDGDGNKSEVFVVNADGSNPTRLTHSLLGDGCWPSGWSPNSTQIMYYCYQEGHYQLFAMNADGSNQRRLLTDPAWNAVPSMSPDGAKIIFSSHQGGNYEIYVMDADGGNPAILTVAPGSDWWPTWSEDGSKIIFETQREGATQIYWMNPDGTGQTRLTDGIGTNGTPAWRPR